MMIDQNGVHLGKDGWLFLAAGSNEALRLLTDPSLFVVEDAENWAAKLSERRRIINGLGAQYLHMWVPDKIKVYSEQLNFDPDILRVDPPHMVRQCHAAADLGDTIVDPLPELLKYKSERLLFWKTDTHWTYWGACAAYLALCSACGTNPVDCWGRPVHNLNLTLDLGSKLVPPVQEQWGGAQVLRDSKIVFKNEVVRFLEILNPALSEPMLRGTCVRFRNSSADCDKRRVIVFGDSFCEYRPHLLTGLLAETFQEVIFAWSPSIDYSLVEKFRADLVITEMAERFIKNSFDRNFPADGFDFYNFALDRLTGFINDKCGNVPNLLSRDKTRTDGLAALIGLP
nr:hypothetical protein [uncultured Rhodopila sp.]